MENGDIIPVDEGAKVTVGAIPLGETDTSYFDYTVSYVCGEVHGDNGNVRTDIVNNVRDGFRIVKTDMQGNPLSGAHFVLSDEDDNPVGQNEYVSDNNGLIGTMYLSDGNYSLQETISPVGFVGIQEDLLIHVSEGVISVDVSDDLQDFYDVVEESGMITLYVRNQVSSFSIKKVDENGEGIENVHFAIYRQVKDSYGRLRKDYYPLTDYSDLISDEDGLVVSELESLPVGTYYLSEISVPEEYVLLSEDIVFTISSTGLVVVEGQDDVSLDICQNNDGIVYVLSVVNRPVGVKMRFRKVDSVRYDSVYLSGAVFDLYSVIDGEKSAEPIYSGLTSDEDGLLMIDNRTVFTLPVGSYLLEEIHSPSVYKKRTQDVFVTVGNRDVNYDEGTFLSDEGLGKHYDDETMIYTLDISNVKVMPVPVTGINERLYVQIILLLLSFSVSWLVFRKKDRESN